MAVTVIKVSPAGVQLWGTPTQGRQAGRGPGFKGNPKITATSDGSIVVGWINGNNLTLQRLSSHGGRQWGDSWNYNHCPRRLDLLDGGLARGR